MPNPKYFGFDTMSLHAGQQPDPSTGARATPIYQTASFVFPDTDYAAGLFNIERAGHVYSRISNPTNAVLEERITALEGGIGAIATASGQAAMHLAVATIAGAGRLTLRWNAQPSTFWYTKHRCRHLVLLSWVRTLFFTRSLMTA